MWEGFGDCGDFDGPGASRQGYAERFRHRVVSPAREGSTPPPLTTHSHDYLGTFLRGDMVIYAGERSTDRYVLMCDCGDIVEACPVRSSITNERCRLPEGHPMDSAERFHRYAR